MARFSERYGYIKPSDIIIKEEMTDEIQNSICNCFRSFESKIGYATFSDIEKSIHIEFLNEHTDSFRKDLINRYFLDINIFWYKKLDLLEYIFHRLTINNKTVRLSQLISDLNNSFSRLNYGYRIINNQIVEVISQEEINAIEEALSSKENIRIHLENALKLYSQKPNGDYRNSIKESISAVEALCRSLTGEDTLGASLKKLEDSGVYMQRFLKDSFTKLYVYTNDKETGIRHALMDAENIPDKEDAYYMLITCSAFINYINQKIAAKNKAE